MTQTIADPLWTFDRFAAGQDFGTIDVPIDTARIGGWQAVYGPITGPKAPDGLIVAGMMEAYILAIQPRPNGNVHAAQKLSFTGAQAAVGDVVSYRVGIAHTEEKKGRFWVTFSIEAAQGGTPLMHGELVSIWAA